jgi:hypothetical protein
MRVVVNVPHIDARVCYTLHGWSHTIELQSDWQDYLHLGLSIMTVKIYGYTYILYHFPNTQNKYNTNVDSRVADLSDLSNNNNNNNNNNNAENLCDDRVR